MTRVAAMARLVRVAGVAAGALLLSAHIGSPNVFFSGAAGPYDVRVVVRPPQVVPGVARVTVRTSSADVERVAIRPVYWRAGTRGAPSADLMRRLDERTPAFEGELWLMERGAYTVDVMVHGARGSANVLVPVASVATGRLEMGGGLAALLLLLGLVLCAGLVNIVYKSAGESLLPEGGSLDPARRRRARRVAALSVPVIGLALLGGARWWSAVDSEYQARLYRPSPLLLERDSSTLRVQLSDTLWQPGRMVSALVPDHGKLMHMFLVRTGDARGFAHLHPVPVDTSSIPAFVTRLPPLPPGDYHAYGDVVHETGFERTLVATVTLDSGARTGGALLDADDAWYVGDASRDSVVQLEDGSLMRMELLPGSPVQANDEHTIRVAVTDQRGRPVRLEPYLGMVAHAVVVRMDGSVYVHLHPMGTVSTAAQQVFHARDRGDTTAAGRVRLDGHAEHGVHAPAVRADSLERAVEFPYAFPRSGSYRVFVQVKRNGRIMTGAFAVPVAERAGPEN